MLPAQDDERQDEERVMAIGDQWQDGRHDRGPGSLRPWDGHSRRYRRRRSRGGRGTTGPAGLSRRGGVHSLISGRGTVAVQQQESRQLGLVRIDEQGETASDSQKPQLDGGPEPSDWWAGFVPEMADDPRHDPDAEDRRPASTPPCRFTQTATRIGKTQSRCSRPGPALASTRSSKSRIRYVNN